MCKVAQLKNPQCCTHIVWQNGRNCTTVISVSNSHLGTQFWNMEHAILFQEKPPNAGLPKENRSNGTFKAKLWPPNTNIIRIRTHIYMIVRRSCLTMLWSLQCLSWFRLLWSNLWSLMLQIPQRLVLSCWLGGHNHTRTSCLSVLQGFPVKKRLQWLHCHCWRCPEVHARSPGRASHPTSQNGLQSSTLMQSYTKIQ